ncbi:hypothetical protein [Streptomyces rimosus]|uniref:hypothetical protein n=1 Tax=Streptomyces rimosus TaxID=1927 RepID=UPI0004C62DEE|nr:hypothetical protein [Streptomyces rimosus]
MRQATVEPGDARERFGPWMTSCALRYTAVFWFAWEVAWTMLPERTDEARRLPNLLEELVTGGIAMFSLVGLPSLLIILLLAPRRTLREQDEFRVLAGLLLAIPVAPLMLGFGSSYVVFPVVQIVFAGWLLPLPTRCVLAWVEPGRERERKRWAK